VRTDLALLLDGEGVLLAEEDDSALGDKESATG
jgi:hypothetical protein